MRELEEQLTTERQQGTVAQEQPGGDGGDGGEWRRKHDALLARHQQLQQQLLAVRDIHGIDMPMLAGDVALVPDGAPTAAAVQATLASVQARQDEAERRMAEVLQRREAAERKRAQDWQGKVDTLLGQVRPAAFPTVHQLETPHLYTRSSTVCVMHAVLLYVCECC